MASDGLQETMLFLGLDPFGADSQPEGAPEMHDRMQQDGGFAGGTESGDRPQPSLGGGADLPRLRRPD